MQLAEVKRLTGLSRKAIDLYEERGLICPGKVSVGELRAYREYTQEDVERLKTIARLRELDMPLQDVRRVIDGENVDIVLQGHLNRQREKADELRLTLEKLGEVLNRLPPNASGRNMAAILEEVLPGEVNDRLSYKLERDYSGGQTRRITMLMFETFLDKPFVSREQWDVWYAILEQMEACITPQMADHYADIYGGLSTEQLHRDYALRRSLVVAYTQYGPEQERAKAEEIFAELGKLAAREDVLAHWKEYYLKIVHGSSIPEGISDMLNSLSNVYAAYTRRFEHMKRRYLDPALRSLEGNALRERVVASLGEGMFTSHALIYFDFYNHTYRRLIHEPWTDA